MTLMQNVARNLGPLPHYLYLLARKRYLDWKIKRLQAQNALLAAENALLEAQERIAREQGL